MRLIVVATLTLALTLISTVPAAADEPADGYVDLVLTASLDKPAYLSTDEVSLNITIVNNSTTVATEVSAAPSGHLPFLRSDFGVLDDYGPGVTLAPGEQVSVTVTVRPMHRPEPLFFSPMRGDVLAESVEPDRDPANNRVHLEAPVTLLRGNVSGVVYGDRDGDRQIDPGEPFRGVEVWISGGLPNASVRARTDAAGRVAFPDIPAGDYSVSIELPAGWQHHQHSFAVGEGDNELVIRGVRGAQLSATVAFDRDTYAVGDTIRERVTITNGGSEDLTGVAALCGGTGNPNQLHSGYWGDLAYSVGPGITLRAGETRTFEFTDVVPQGAWEWGTVRLDCDFGTDAISPVDGVHVSARARVPGGRGTVGGLVYYDRGNNAPNESEAVPGVKLLLMTETGTVAARAITDARGRFRFVDLPAGWYEVRLVGPWRFVDHPTERLLVRGGRTWENEQISIAPGPTQPDPEAPPATTPPGPSTSDIPEPRPSIPPRLADTGVQVTELTGIGLLLLLSGAGLLLVRRKEA